MSLKSLITGETIEIDNHRRGANIGIDDESIHLHKRFNKGSKRFKRAQVTVNLNRDGVDLKNARGNDSQVIIKEIQHAFRDYELRSAFVSALIEQMHEPALYSSNNDYFTIENNERKLSAAGKGKIKEIIERVYKFFKGPQEELKKLQYILDSGVIGQFVPNLQSHHSHYIKADLQKHSFSLSSSLEELQARKH